MPGILTIAKKEFTDHVSDHTFLLCFGVLLLVMITGSYGFVLDVQEEVLRNPSMERQFGSDFFWKENYVGLVTAIIRPFSLLGILAAIVVSINSISKERIEGSLKVLLSYPLNKSELILGKILGGALVLAAVAMSSMIICFSLVMFYLSIAPTYEILARIAVVVGLGMVLLFFILCVGTTLSILFRDANTVLIGSILVVNALQPEMMQMTLLSLSVILPQIGIHFNIPQLLRYGNPPTFLYSTAEFRKIAAFTPTESYLSFSYSIFKFQNYSSYPKDTVIPVNFDWLIPRYLDLAQTVILWAFAAFIVCYLLFRRGDVG